MRIQSVHIKNTGVFINETIDFACCRPQGAEIHIFTGPNGSGKSTILHSLAAGFNHVAINKRCQVVHNDLYKRFHSFENDGNKFKSQIEIVLDDGKTVSSYGCPKCKNMHIVTNSRRIEDYQSQMGLDEVSSYEFEFALYASSGYRMVDYQFPYSTNLISNNNNILFQSLEFEKKQAQLMPIEEWIWQVLMNKYASIGQAQNGNTSVKPQLHAQVIDRITMAIRQVVGNDFDFILQLQPPTVKFKYGRSTNELEFNLLADGLKSLISWMADLAKMLNGLHWKDKNKSVLDQNIIIFLDEIEVHLHPLWQRKVLPMVTTLFPNAQIFASSHSPFIINSVDGAWIYKLKTNENGNTQITKHQSNTAVSYLTEYISTFGVEEEFGEPTQIELDKFQDAIDNLGDNISNDEIVNIKSLANNLLQRDSIAINNTVGISLRRLNRLKKINITL